MLQLKVYFCHQLSLNIAIGSPPSLSHITIVHSLRDWLGVGIVCGVRSQSLKSTAILMRAVLSYDKSSMSIKTTSQQENFVGNFTNFTDLKVIWEVSKSLNKVLHLISFGISYIVKWPRICTDKNLRLIQIHLYLHFVCNKTSNPPKKDLQKIYSSTLLQH